MSLMLSFVGNVPSVELQIPFVRFVFLQKCAISIEVLAFSDLWVVVGIGKSLLFC